MKWAIDPAHSSATFAIRHMMSKVRGNVSIKEGWIEADDKEDPASAKVDVVLDAATINTGVAARDADLRSPNHLDTAKFPTVTFQSKRIEGKDPKHFVVIGDLSIHGVTKEFRLDCSFGGEAKDPWGNRRLSFSGKTRINRKDFGLTWNAALETGGFLVGDDLDVDLEVEAIPAAKPEEAKAKIEATAKAESSS
ncbi:MAG TPA: YceI family protein [Candidatus Dormibacteraeota bacterium]|jgi:polyisoprenoid-binding protein YceI